MQHGTKKHSCKAVYASLLIMAVISLTGTHSLAAELVSSGGSNYFCYQLDAEPSKSGNCRRRHGIIANYHQPGVRELVQEQLLAMRGAGQVRLRVPIFHKRISGMARCGLVMNSSGGNLSPQNRKNLANFLSDIKNAGFVEIEVGLFPIGKNNPLFWTSWQESYFQENWNLIVNLRPIIRDAGIAYRIDLMNEGAPANHQIEAHRYVFSLWWNYNYVFGKTDTVGFSIGNANVFRYLNMVNLMYSTGFGLPYLWSIHIYDDFEEKATALDELMHFMGDRRSWVIGETYYNDPITDEDIERFQPNRIVWHVYQWPLHREETECKGVNIAPPIDYRYFN